MIVHMVIKHEEYMQKKVESWHKMFLLGQYRPNKNNNKRRKQIDGMEEYKTRTWSHYFMCALCWKSALTILFS